MTSPPAALVVPAQKPTVATAPVVTPIGEPAVGITYDTTAGIWNGTPTITYAYQWYDCNSTGTTCSAIAGATGTSYVSTSSDLGSYLEVIVTATNSGGTGQAASNLAPTSD